MTGQNLNFMRELEAAIVSDWPNGEANIAKEMLSDSVNPITGQIDKETYCHQLRIASRGCIEVASVYSLELTALYSESIGERLYKTSPQFTNKVEKAMKLIQDISKTEEFFGLRDYYDKKYIERGSHIFHHRIRS